MAKLDRNVRPAHKRRLLIGAILSLGIALGAWLIILVRRPAAPESSAELAQDPGVPRVQWRLELDGRDERGHADLEASPRSDGDGGGPVFEAGAARFDGCLVPQRCNGPRLRGSTNNPYLTFGDQFTISLWIRFDRGIGDRNVVFDNGQIELAHIYTGRMSFTLIGPNGIPTMRVFGGDTVLRGVWHHVAVSRRGRSARLWVDGVSSAGALDADTLGPPAPYFVLGGASTFEPWNGMIDEVTIWDRELSSAQLSTLVR